MENINFDQVMTCEKESHEGKSWMLWKCMYTGMEGQVEWSGRESFCKEGTFKLRLRLVRRSETGEKWWAGHFRSYQGGR